VWKWNDVEWLFLGQSSARFSWSTDEKKALGESFRALLAYEKAMLPYVVMHFTAVSRITTNLLTVEKPRAYLYGYVSIF